VFPFDASWSGAWGLTWQLSEVSFLTSKIPDYKDSGSQIPDTTAMLLIAQANVDRYLLLFHHRNLVSCPSALWLGTCDPTALCDIARLNGNGMYGMYALQFTTGSTHIGTGRA
jgi:hypothetical protein